MSKSILMTIRQMIGPSASYDVFDTDLIIHINTAFSRLCQLGVGPKTPFKIADDTATWDDFINSDTEGFYDRSAEDMIADISQYIYLKTRMIFDPPASSSVANAFQAQIDTLEWTLKETARYGY